MAHVEDTSCCAIEDFDGLRDCKSAAEVLEIVGQRRFEEGNQTAFYMFTDLNEATRLKSVITYIERKKLGVVTKSPSRKNPNTANRVTVLIWAVNERNFRAWYRKRNPDAYFGY